MSQTLSDPAFYAAPARTAARPSAVRPPIDWGRADGLAAALRDAIGDAVLFGLVALPAAASGAIIVSALGWRIV